MNWSSVSLLNLILSVTGVRFPCRVFGSTKQLSPHVAVVGAPSALFRANARRRFGSILGPGRAQCNATIVLCIVRDDAATAPVDPPRPGRQPRRDRRPG